MTQAVIYDSITSNRGGVTVLRDELQGRQFAAWAGRRMYLYLEDGSETFSFEIAPRQISYNGLAMEWEKVERTGTVPLLNFKADSLETMSFSFTQSDRWSHLREQEGGIAVLRRMAKSQKRVLVRYGPSEVGLWRMTKLDIESVDRHPETNVITRTTTNIELTRASDPAPAVGPVTGGTAAPAPPAPARTHRVVKGDCLWNIAKRYYGNGAKWPRIFDANRSKIKDPHWIYPGQVFTIP